MFTAGQIGLDPATMSLVSPSLQPSLALNHITTVLDASHTHLTSALCGICYYTTEEAGWIARMTWGKVSLHIKLLLIKSPDHVCVCVCVCVHISCNNIV